MISNISTRKSFRYELGPIYFYFIFVYIDKQEMLWNVGLAFILFMFFFNVDKVKLECE